MVTTANTNKTKIYNLIILDESSATSGLITRLESFIDIVKVRRDNV